MLRYGHMPSDFHPLFLILGEAADLRLLVRALRAFAAEPREFRFGPDLPCGPSATPLSLVPAESDHGMRPAGEGGAFGWRLNAWQAGEIAGRIEALADPAHRSGSDIFELGALGEVPVKVSRGEFTDDFLVGEQR